MLRLLSTVCALGVLLSGGLAAQGVPISWPPLSEAPASALYATPAAGPLGSRAFATGPADTVARQIKPTYWKEGGAIGAVALGVFAIWFVHELCTNSDAAGSCGVREYVLGPLSGGAFGFGLGALVGGQFPKHPKESPLSGRLTRVRVGR